MTYHAESEAYSDTDVTVTHNWAAYEYCVLSNPDYIVPPYETATCPTTQWHFDIEEIRFPIGPGLT